MSLTDQPFIRPTDIHGCLWSRVHATKKVAPSDRDQREWPNGSSRIGIHAKCYMQWIKCVTNYSVITIPSNQQPGFHPGTRNQSRLCIFQWKIPTGSFDQLYDPCGWIQGAQHWPIDRRLRKCHIDGNKAIKESDAVMPAKSSHKKFQWFSFFSFSSKKTRLKDLKKVNLRLVKFTQDLFVTRRRQAISFCCTAATRMQ